MNEHDESTTDRYAKVDVIAPNGTVEDSVKVQFDREQLIGIDPMAHADLGVKKDEYRLQLRYIVVDDVHYLAGEERPLPPDTETHGET